MAKTSSKLDSAVGTLKRGVIGFVAGFVVACFVLVFNGTLPAGPSNDLNALEIDQQTRSLWMAFYIAIGIAVLTMIAGRVRLSQFWLWFVLAFGVICVVPFWPHKDGSLLPFATPYVNFGFHATDAIILSVHVSIALAVAAIIQWIWPMMKQRKKGHINAVNGSRR
jgi:hypothetical protein